MKNGDLSLIANPHDARVALCHRAASEPAPHAERLVNMIDRSYDAAEAIRFSSVKLTESQVDRLVGLIDKSTDAACVLGFADADVIAPHAASLAGRIKFSSDARIVLCETDADVIAPHIGTLVALINCSRDAACVLRKTSYDLIRPYARDLVALVRSSSDALELILDAKLPAPYPAELVYSLEYPMQVAKFLRLADAELVESHAKFVVNRILDPHSAVEAASRFDNPCVLEPYMPELVEMVKYGGADAAYDMLRHGNESLIAPYIEDLRELANSCE
jgi:hypothetical protein